MIWSDRGGASREIGNRWAIRTTDALAERVGMSWPVPHGTPFTLLDVIRLDDVPEVSIEANRMQLENPDFLLIGERGNGKPPVLQAVDAKFAADRIKPSQVSAEVVLNLLAIPGGTTALLVSERAAARGLAEPRVERGVFVVPDSELTTHLLRRVSHGRNATVDLAEVVRVPAEPGSMFSGLPQSRAIGTLARIDALPVTPRSNVISAVYYFRLACACFHHWAEQEKPLLSSAPPPDPAAGVVVADIARRAESASSAFELVSTWAIEVEPFVQAREAVSNVATLPVRMRDIRERVERAGKNDGNRALRFVRREIELEFRSRLLNLTGEIRSDDPRPLAAILDDVARASRSLNADMKALLDELIERAPAGSADDQSVSHDG
ncbi:MAG TPA: hypothetical protein VMM78_04385 [Thermomicrobiales bacterium]|nr:hypothetical protein [Thermomicrobiales bacterium]